MTLPEIYMAMFFFMFCYIICKKWRKTLSWKFMDESYIKSTYGSKIQARWIRFCRLYLILKSIIFQSNFQCHFGHYGRKDFQGTKWNQGYDCGQIESTHYNHVRPRCRYVSKVKRRLLYRGSLLNISKVIWNNVIPKNVLFH